MPFQELPGRREQRGRALILGILLLVLLFGSRAAASYVLDYEWWKELGQLHTWLAMLLYAVAPGVAAGIVTFVILWVVHARGLKTAGAGLRENPLYAKLSAIVLLAISAIIAGVTIDAWTVVRYFGGRGLPTAAANSWMDPVFHLPLAFYLFQLPFYSLLLRVVLTISLVAALVYWLTVRLWQFRDRFPDFARSATFDLGDLRLLGSLESTLLRVLVAIFLIALAGRFYLDRYAMLLDDHGFMVGIDYVAEHVRLPLQLLMIAACLAAAVLFWFGRRILAASMALVLVLQSGIPFAVNALHVRPNEISIQRPYIQRHIEATRSAFGLNQHAREIDYPAKLEAHIDENRNRLLLDNVRLWDWRAFHDTLMQIQPLRPYVFSDTDVDRYIIDGRLRQVLLSPRELDLSQLGDARSSWINPHFIYTHGYGIVMAEANRITPTGLPQLFIKDAPPVIESPSLKLARPEIYYSEVSHEPVFVHTGQPEFNYPSGADNVHTTYEGKGGFPISSLTLRTAAAVAYGDWNILLTGYLSPDSRMMIHRKVLERLQTLAGFITWDTDPYLVLTSAGRLVWIVDGYLTSDAHPYSRSVDMENGGSFNYIRNSVKATVDAYNGDTHLYIFDPADPLVQAYRNLFPDLFLPESAMPADLRAHTRYPEMLFSAQAGIYRTFHMRDAEAFYNRADLWDFARSINGPAGRPEAVTPNYVVATLPGEQTPEFLLMIPFTPRNKDNLLGLMMARCDGAHLGEIVILLLPKQELILGPMQIQARINQDQNISKDLTLWNQQGSSVLRGQMVVLPVDDTFLYVEPIYIQASEAKMPQLKKVALAMGNTLIYTDTYDEALAELAVGHPVQVTVASSSGASSPAPHASSSAQPSGADTRIDAIRSHLRRYRDLSAQGKWAEAGKELEAIDALVQSK